MKKLCFWASVGTGVLLVGFGVRSDAQQPSAAGKVTVLASAADVQRTLAPALSMAPKKGAIEIKEDPDIEFVETAKSADLPDGTPLDSAFVRMQAARQQSRTETVQQLTPVLTPTQLKKFQVLMDEEHDGGHGRRHGSPSG